jgi:hypothetical protein
MAFHMGEGRRGVQGMVDLNHRGAAVDRQPQPSPSAEADDREAERDLSEKDVERCGSPSMQL